MYHYGDKDSTITRSKTTPFTVICRQNIIQLNFERAKFNITITQIIEHTTFLCEENPGYGLKNDKSYRVSQKNVNNFNDL